MADKCSFGKKHMLTFTIGVIGGGILLAWATKAMPKMMSGINAKYDESYGWRRL